MKTSVVVLSFGFAVLGLIGVATNATVWISWAAVLGGLLGSTVAIALPESRRKAESYVALAVGAVSGTLWIAAMALRVSDWMPKWTLAFAIGFFVTAAVAYSGRTADANAAA